MKEKFRIVDGIHFGDDDIRAEAGEERDDLPPQSIEWLLEAGHIERVAQPSERLTGVQRKGRATKK
ncbi:MAG: hypothetical protein QOD00_1702 [Blastocatellia bacterium]|jgi:hypothetical protein|nr:hypothetical protein [Blastocatellia bacterium]